MPNQYLIFINYKLNKIRSLNQKNQIKEICSYYKSYKLLQILIEAILRLKIHTDVKWQMFNEQKFYQNRKFQIFDLLTSLQYSQSNLVLPMFSSSNQLRATVQGNCIPRRSLSPLVNLPSYQSPFVSPQNKIETKQSFMSEALSNSIISDNCYNSKIYQWRKTQIAPIIKVIQLARTSQVDSMTGIQCTHNTIRSEPILSTLSSGTQFSKEQLLLILKNMLDGHQAIFKKMKATSVSLEKCAITLNGEVKVWVNHHFERNDISGQILNNEETIVKRIFQTVSFLANSYNKLQDFIQYVGSCMKKNGKWTFLSLKAMTKSYTDCLRIKMPKTIPNDPNREIKTVQCSFIQTTPSQIRLFRPRQSSFELPNRNIYSSLNCSSNLRRLSQLSQQSNQNQMPHESFFLNKVMTSKSIHDKQTASTLKSLVSKSKHTNSISGLREEQMKDPILQNSRHRQPIPNKNNINFLGTKLKYDPFKEHKKVPSINEILINKLGISPLREVQDDDQYSNSPSARKPSQFEQQNQQNQTKTLKFNIIPQFELKIEKPLQESFNKPSKDSSISTTNQTISSGYQFCFSKKLKESHMTINLDENKENKKGGEQFRTASRDRFKDVQLTSLTAEPKKFVGSCTNWSNNSNAFDLKNLTKEVNISNIMQTQEESQQSDSIRGSTKLQLQKQVVSYKNLDDCNESQKMMTPGKPISSRIISNKNKNPFSYLNELKSQHEIESYYNTQKNSVSASSPSPSRKKIHVQEKILELLQIKKGLVISTYMQTSSQKKISQHESPQKERQRQKRLRDIQQTLTEIVRANLRQQQILSGNCWTKKLQNLLGIDQQQMKESINFGTEQANALLREIKLSKIGKWGRQIANSVIPE